MTKTALDLDNVQSHDLPMDESDAATAANRALFAGKESARSAREAWALVKETFGEARGPLTDGTPEACARRIAVRLEQEVRRTFGLVSCSAAGLWGITTTGRIFQVDATTYGDDYLDGVRFVKTVDRLSGAIGWAEYEEIPVSHVAAFFDSYRTADEFLNPSPSRTFLGR